MKIFRWQGVLAFVLIGGLVGSFLILFLDGMIERSIEEKGSMAAKTQIDIASLSTSLFAQSIVLAGIEVPTRTTIWKTWSSLRLCPWIWMESRLFPGK